MIILICLMSLPDTFGGIVTEARNGTCIDEGCRSASLLQKATVDGPTTLLKHGRPEVWSGLAASASCWKSLSSLVSDEGGDAGGEVQYVTAESCQQRCDQVATCQSMSVCPAHGKCWLKDKIVTPDMPTTPNGDCKTYYKAACDGPAPGPAPAPAPANEPAPAPAPEPQTPANPTLAGSSIFFGDGRPRPGPAPHDRNSAISMRFRPGPAPIPGPGPRPGPRPGPAPTLSPCSGPTASDPCDVPEGHCGQMTGTADCAVVHIRGRLSIGSNTQLTTELVRVYPQGILEIGTPAQPADMVDINLKQSGELLSDGEVYIYGREKTSWTELAETCDRCQIIKVKQCSGWEVGDDIVLVGNGNGQDAMVQANQQYSSDERKIQSMSDGCQITLDRNVEQKLRAEVINGRIPIISEVLNMKRSVRIFGTGGIRTRQQHGGIMKIHYTRVSNCGQAKLGEYCLHFHHVGPCPHCSFVGNAVGWPSENKALTVHGTSHTLVEGNVLYDHRGAFLYIEDGNEIHNVIKDNALVCPRMRIEQGNQRQCAYPEGIPEQQDSDFREHAGMYVVSATNDFIGNHIVGMENAFFQDFQGGQKVWGGNNNPEANKKVCPQANPFGKIKGNYFHNNNGFGFYSPHSSFPTRVQTNSNGYVSDWNSCLQFNPDTGDDNSAGYVVEDHVELFHNFGAGGYDGGETSFKNTVFAFGLRSNYYKTFRRGVRTGPYCEGCYYYKNLDPNLPGGSCMWEYKDTVFEDTQYGLYINHHCGNSQGQDWTGGLCASHFWFTGSSEWKPSGSFKIKNDGFPAAVSYSDSVVFLQGNTYFGSAEAHPAFNTNSCTTGEAGGKFTKCQASNIRIVRIFSADRGDLRVRNRNENLEITVAYTPWQKKDYARVANHYEARSNYQNGGRGYTFLVKAGQAYTINVGASSTMPDFFTLEYSDIQMPKDSITLSVQGGGIIAGSDCVIESSHRRNWITPYGPYTPESGAWWDCQRWSTSYSPSQWKVDQERHFQNNGVIASTG